MEKVLISIIIVLLVVIIVICLQSNKENNLDGYHIYTSGATMRRLGQVFSSTNQGVYTTIHNVKLRDDEDKPIPVVIFPANKIPHQLINQMWA